MCRRAVPRTRGARCTSRRATYSLATTLHLRSFKGFIIVSNKKDDCRESSFQVAGVGLEPHDLRVMSPTSYQLLHPAICLRSESMHGFPTRCTPHFVGAKIVQKYCKTKFITKKYFDARSRMPMRTCRRYLRAMRTERAQEYVIRHIFRRRAVQMRKFITFAL